MAAHNELGIVGEDRAVAHLLAKGYAIRHRNWRFGHMELDIVAEKDRTIVVVEVKTRSSDQYGGPEEAVTDEKIRRLVSAADAYVRYFHVDWPVRFDIIAIVGEADGRLTVNHIESAFHVPVYFSHTTIPQNR